MEHDRCVVGAVHGHLPHGAPFLFVDHAEVSADRTRAWGRRTFSADEYFFKGHFPADPIVPGVILLELAAQTANLLLSHRAGRMVQGYLVNVDETKFSLPVRPSQTVTAEVRFAREVLPDSYAEPRCVVDFKAVGYLEERRCMRASINIYKAG